jgi:NAD(P)-dependent dehydrogenase (short-subunit alcohol dehydrogenase family)
MDFNPFSLEGKTILVTGASSGIGQAIAIACSKMKATVLISGRNRSKLETTLSLMEGDGHKILIADLTNQDDIYDLVIQLPKLDGIVYNAGIGSRKLCKMIEKEDIDIVMKTNFTSSVLLQSSILSLKKINKGASIVFIASRAAESPSIGNAIYSASKGAIISYAKCLGLELAPRQIRVNCISPAMVWTDLIIQEGVSKEGLEESQQKYPLKRYGKPDDIAYLVIYLLSNASNWMTGSVLDITGGGEQTLI